MLVDQRRVYELYNDLGEGQGISKGVNSATT